jgi:glycerol-3-phosphate O-acyltransferase / dihydroxyacetone phosphate acyltransferase
MPLLTSIVARAVGWTAGVFYQVERSGGQLPDGPVLVTANHPNALLDPLLIFLTAGRPARPLAKAPLFEQVFVGSMLRALGGLPVYRKQDNPAQMHRNDETFRRAIDALEQGDAVQIFPEGRSHSEPGIVELRTGAARIALGAEAQSGWRLGLRIVPVGITYRRKALFRGHALVQIGPPFTIEDLRTEFERDEQAGVRALTDRIAANLQAVTLNLAQREDQQLIETAEALYVREKGMARFREREGLSVRMPRLQRFAEGLAWLRANDPNRHERLRREVARYRQIVDTLGASEGDVPSRYAFGPTASYALRWGCLLLLGAPLAVFGALLWLIPHFIPRVVVRFAKPEYESIATYKLAGAFFVFPLTLAIYAYLAWRWAGPAAALATALLAPLLGFATLAWYAAWKRFGEDVRLFTRVLFRRETAARLAEMRAQLAAEFDAIDAEIDRDLEPARPSS